MQEREHDAREQQVSWLGRERFIGKQRFRRAVETVRGTRAQVRPVPGAHLWLGRRLRGLGALALAHGSERRVSLRRGQAQLTRSLAVETLWLVGCRRELEVETAGKEVRFLLLDNDLWGSELGTLTCVCVFTVTDHQDK